MKKNLKDTIPSFTLGDINPSKIKGLYEVMEGANIYYVSEDGQVGHIDSSGEHKFGIIEEFTAVYDITIDDKGFLWLLSASGPYVVYPEHLR